VNFNAVLRADSFGTVPANIIIERTERRMRMKRVAVISVLLVIAASTLHTQDRLPLSFNEAPGLHVKSYDGLVHRDSSYYEGLCRVVEAEMGITRTPERLHIVFVDQSTSDRIIAANPGRFEGKDFTGAFIAPSLIIMVGEEESDDTFMHEYLHYLHTHGLVFRGVPQSLVHRRIEETEGYLIASASYLSFLSRADH
jgi:hypothetical protein